uniref:LRRCT domain-containing protein n=1 Tax=Panagrolaimus superbus TaxID=310955 RepID=A0A914XW39_9BILA
MLDLSECGLNNLNENIFENLSQLETLYLNVNAFTSIPIAIHFLPNLKILMLGINDFRTLKKNSFESNVQLERLSFVGCQKLQTIEDCAFCHLPNLKSARFYFNPILSYIHENAFGAISDGNVPEIKEFNIEYCNISVLPENLFDWKKVEKLQIGHNPFACNCSMAWLFNDLLSNNSIFEEKLGSSSIMFYNHKYNLGCLGTQKWSANRTDSKAITEMFAVCNTTSTSNHFFCIIIAFIGVILAAFGIYANRIILTEMSRM